MHLHIWTYCIKKSEQSYAFVNTIPNWMNSRCHCSSKGPAKNCSIVGSDSLRMPVYQFELSVSWLCAFSSFLLLIYDLMSTPEPAVREKVIEYVAFPPHILFSTIPNIPLPVVSLCSLGQIMTRSQAHINFPIGALEDLNESLSDSNPAAWGLWAPTEEKLPQWIMSQFFLVLDRPRNRTTDSNGKYFPINPYVS